MSEGIAELARRLVIGHKRDGRGVYDPQVKRELVEVSRQPGVSVAKLARECGINANLLASWIRLEGRSKVAVDTRSDVVEISSPAFMPVRVEAAVPEQPEATLNVQARLPNGVVVDMRDCDLQQAQHLLEALAGC
jgi:transposase